MLIEPDVIDVNALSWGERHDLLADAHLATPERVFMLARALDVRCGARVRVMRRQIDTASQRFLEDGVSLERLCDDSPLRLREISDRPR